jgi:glycosyltransferase involved in cell wall biosynthesis
MPSVDVVVPCYNYGHYLAACVRSVLDQDGVSVRVLILDDASSDDSETVGRALAAADSRVQYRRHATNHGHIATFNEGIDWAGGEYFLLISADDLLVPGSLRRATALMENDPAVAMTFGRVIFIDDDGKPVRDRPCTRARPVMSGLEFWQLCCATAGNVVWTPSAVVRTAVQRAIGGYRADLPHAGDLEMWLRFAAHGKVGYVAEVQGLYRVHGQNMSVLKFDAAKDIEQRMAAFDVMFRDYARDMPDRARVQRDVRQILGWRAFWLASDAFDRGDADACARCYQLAMQLWPRARRSGAWFRFQCKRALGRRAWTKLRPLVERLRGNPAAATITSLVPVLPV